jgi:hypothetical protein
MNFIKAAIQAKTGSQRSLDQANRVVYPVLAVVCKIGDDRRVKVADPANPKIESEWLRRLGAFPGFDPPMPEIGHTVLCMFVDGLFNNGWFIPVENQTNPPQDTPEPLKDSAMIIPGSNIRQVDQNDDKRVEENLTYRVGKQATFVNDAGASLTLLEAGATEFKDAFGNQIVVGGLSAGLPYLSDLVIDFNTDIRINLNGQELKILNAAGVSINNLQVVVVGSTDSDGDVNNTRGY